MCSLNIHRVPAAITELRNSYSAPSLLGTCHMVDGLSGRPSLGISNRRSTAHRLLCDVPQQHKPSRSFLVMMRDNAHSQGLPVLTAPLAEAGEQFVHSRSAASCHAQDPSGGQALSAAVCAPTADELPARTHMLAVVSSLLMLRCCFIPRDAGESDEWALREWRVSWLLWPARGLPAYRPIHRPLPQVHERP
jgi:hypothetical protein